MQRSFDVTAAACTTMWLLSEDGAPWPKYHACSCSRSCVLLRSFCKWFQSIRLKGILSQNRLRLLDFCYKPYACASHLKGEAGYLVIHELIHNVAGYGSIIKSSKEFYPHGRAKLYQSDDLCTTFSGIYWLFCKQTGLELARWQKKGEGFVVGDFFVLFAHSPLRNGGCLVIRRRSGYRSHILFLTNQYLPLSSRILLLAKIGT